MSDHAYVRKYYHDLRRFNIEGDTTWVEGEVVRKWIEGDLHLIETRSSCQNQRGEPTGNCRMEVVLPSRGIQ